VLVGTLLERLAEDPEAAALLLDVDGTLAPIVARPLAAVIARDRNAVKPPADLAGKTVGVTGLPSDDAVLDSVLASAGLGPDSVHRITIGFGAIPALAAGRIDAATAFWNAEGVTLKRRGVPIRVFRVDDFGAPAQTTSVERKVYAPDGKLVSDATWYSSYRAEPKIVRIGPKKTAPKKEPKTTTTTSTTETAPTAPR